MTATAPLISYQKGIVCLISSQLLTTSAPLVIESIFHTPRLTDRVLSRTGAEPPPAISIQGGILMQIYTGLFWFYCFGENMVPLGEKRKDVKDPDNWRRLPVPPVPRQSDAS